MILLQKHYPILSNKFSRFTQPTNRRHSLSYYTKRRVRSKMSIKSRNMIRSILFGLFCIPQVDGEFVWCTKNAVKSPSVSWSSQDGWMGSKFCRVEETIVILWKTKETRSLTNDFSFFSAFVPPFSFLASYGLLSQLSLLSHKMLNEGRSHQGVAMSHSNLVAIPMKWCVYPEEIFFDDKEKKMLLRHLSLLVCRE